VTDRPLLLDLFCCAGGCAVGYHRAGFDVVGVDHEPKPNYPFRLVRADALEFLVEHGQEFDAIHASPPCQRYTVGRKIHNSGDRHPDLVGPCRGLLEQTGKPWIMENVVGAPMSGYSATYCGLMFGLRVLRHRLFEASFLLMSPPHPQHPKGDLTGSCKGYSTGANGFVTVAGNNFVREAGAKAMGIDWPMTRKELAQAIPPAYTEHAGRQLMDMVGERGAA
jgi:DNA (cytosine-5)-methyltransferase 1